MTTNQFRKPLLQSVALIVLFLIFISFVVSSGADDLGGGLLAVLSGIFHSILLFVGLFVSLLFSLLLLIVLFLAAMALYSIDKAKETGTQLLTTTAHLAEQIKETLLGMKIKYRCNQDSQSLKIAELEKTIEQLATENRQLREKMDRLSQQVSRRSQEELRDNETQQASAPFLEK